MTDLPSTVTRTLPCVDLRGAVPLTFTLTVAILSAAILSACGDVATLSISAGYGTKRTLPAPHRSLIPTVNVAHAVSWPQGGMPQATPNVSAHSPSDLSNRAGFMSCRMATCWMARGSRAG